MVKINFFSKNSPATQKSKTSHHGEKLFQALSEKEYLTRGTKTALDNFVLEKKEIKK